MKIGRPFYQKWIAKFRAVENIEISRCWLWSPNCFLFRQILQDSSLPEAPFAGKFSVNSSSIKSSAKEPLCIPPRG